MGKVLALIGATTLVVLCPQHGWGFQKPDRAPLPDFDSRQPAGNPLAEKRQTALSGLKQRKPTVEVTFDPVLVTPRSVHARKGFLTGPDAEAALNPQPVPTAILPPALRGQKPVAPDTYRPIKRFFMDNQDLFEHGAEVLDTARIEREYVTAHNGLRSVVWEQRLDGVPVFGARIIAHLSRRGELVSLSSRALPKLEEASGLPKAQRAAGLANPPVSAAGAVARAAASLGDNVTVEDLVLAEVDAARGVQSFRSARLGEDARASLVWLPMNRSSLRLCWEIFVRGRQRPESYRVLIDAQTGESLMRHCLTVNLTDASYLVFPSDSPSPFSPGHSQPLTSQPAVTSRQLLTLSALSPVASPNGWINDGVNETIGNNVDAHVDWGELNKNYGDDPSPNPARPSGSPSRVFQPPLDLEGDPMDYDGAGAVVNLFYWCNWMHDKLYDLGFTEAAGNFQQDNYGRGGAQNDALLADAQDGEGVNNANFNMTPDGTAPRMQMYLWSGPSPARDGSLDAEIVLHEYTHGLSARLVGGGMALFTPESAAMGEGWSDFYALAMLSNPADASDGCHAFGAYVTFQWPDATFEYEENYYYGIRRYPYTTDMTKNPLTLRHADYILGTLPTGIPRNPRWAYQDAGFASEFHNAGEIWCATLWEVRANLIAKHGFAIGNNLILQMVTDGMRLTPPFPDFLDGRDAILLADRVLTGGANQTELWAAFAKRGMGYRASWVRYVGSFDYFQHAFEDFSMPPSAHQPWEYSLQPSLSSPAVGSDGTIYVGTTNGLLLALNPDGTLKWQFAAPAGFNAFNSSPAVSREGTVYIGCQNHRLYAIHPNGSEKWSYLAPAEVMTTSAVSSDGTIYFGTFGGEMYALTSNGALKPGWPRYVGGPIRSSPAIGNDGSIHVGAQNQLATLAPSGNPLWWYETCAIPSDGFCLPALTSPAVGVDGSIYFTQKHAEDSGLAGLHSVSAAGSLRWFHAGVQPTSSPVIGPDQTSYFGAEGGEIRAVRADGNFKWTRNLPATLHTCPLVTEQLVIVPVGSKVYTLAANTGAIVSTLDLDAGETAVSSPVLSDTGTLYFTSTAKLYARPNFAFPLPDGWGSFHRDARHLGNNDEIKLAPRGMLTNQALSGRFQLRLSNPRSTAGRLEATTDFVNWQTIGIVPAQTSMEMTDSTSPSFSHRFYRIVVP